MLKARAALLGLSVLACQTREASLPKASPVVLISIDTLRADHLPAYGYKSGATPVLDALRAEAVVFDEAYSHCPLTLPAHASLFTGLLPPRHGVRDNIGFTLGGAHRTLAERFKAAGWHTGGAVSAFVLRSSTGIARGFDFYDDAVEIEGAPDALSSVRRDGSAAVEALGRWVDLQTDPRFFAFLHLYEPHAPCSPPERYGYLPQPYDGAIAYADELVGRFLDHLKARRVFDGALVAVVSDHGEGLGDHGEDEHGILLYREALHVPFILRLPRGTGKGRTVRATVAQVDVPATLLDLAGLPADGMEGRSLRRALLGEPEAPHRVYSETLYPRYHLGWSDLYAVTEARSRYIRAPRPEFFDIDIDPAEKRNLADSPTAAARAMARWLEGQIGEAPVPAESGEDVRERLRALGYLGDATSTASRGHLPDPKDKIGEYEGFKRALGLRAAGRDGEAVVLFRKVLEESPRMLDAWEMLGLTLVRLDRTKEALEAFRRGLEVDPLEPQIHLALAKLHGLDHKPDLAARHAELAAHRSPGEGFETLAELAMDRDDLRLAEAYARKSLAADPRGVMSHFILGVIAQKAGRYGEALASFQEAEEAMRLQKKAVVRNLHSNAADCLARLGRGAEAEREFRTELDVVPSSREARVGLGMLYRSEGRDQEARDVLAGLIATERRPSPETYWVVVHTLFVLGDREGARDWANRARALYPQDPRFRPSDP